MWAGQGLWGSLSLAWQGQPCPGRTHTDTSQGGSYSSPQSVPSGSADAGPGGSRREARGGLSRWPYSSAAPTWTADSPPCPPCPAPSLLPPCPLLLLPSPPSSAAQLSRTWRECFLIVPWDARGPGRPWPPVHTCSATLSQAGLCLSSEGGDRRPHAACAPSMAPGLRCPHGVGTCPRLRLGRVGTSRLFLVPVLGGRSKSPWESAAWLGSMSASECGRVRGPTRHSWCKREFGALQNHHHFQDGGGGMAGPVPWLGRGAPRPPSCAQGLPGLGRLPLRLSLVAPRSPCTLAALFKREALRGLPPGLLACPLFNP